MKSINLEDFRRAAESKLEKSAFDYYASGAHDEITLERNRRAFDELSLYYKVLVDVSKREHSTTIFGRQISMPILVAPTAFHGLACEDGEEATARAARSAGTVMILSTLSNRPIERVAEASDGLWFQLYFYKNREATQALVERAESAGAEALVLTVDAPLLGCREADVRNRFKLPPHLNLVNLLGHGDLHSDLPAQPEGSGLAAYFVSLIETALTWKDLAWLKSITKLPLIVKGVVRADDARRAVDHGVDGIVVSNHGGRQLDTSPATIEALPAVMKSVGDEVPVFLDGGVRRGTDVVKALAYGCTAVLVGRPVLWGLGTAGEEGVREVLELLRRELDLAMALCGTPTVESIKHGDLLQR